MADAVLLYLAMHVQHVSRLLLRLVGSLGLNLLSSQTAVDLDEGSRNDEKSYSTTTYTDCIPQFIVQEGHKGQRQAKRPDEGQYCTNSPGRHNLLILDVEEQSGVSVQAYCCQTQQ